MFVALCVGACARSSVPSAQRGGRSSSAGGAAERWGVITAGAARCSCARLPGSDGAPMIPCFASSAPQCFPASRKVCVAAACLHACACASVCSLAASALSITALANKSTSGPAGLPTIQAWHVALPLGCMLGVSAIDLCWAQRSERVLPALLCVPSLWHATRDAHRTTSHTAVAAFATCRRGNTFVRARLPGACWVQLLLCVP